MRAEPCLEASDASGRQARAVREARWPTNMRAVGKEFAKVLKHMLRSLD